MKQFAFPFVLIVFCIVSTYSQDSSATFTVSTANAAAYNKAGSVVSAVKMNVLYVGVDNLIGISVPGVAGKDIAASINNDGSIEKREDGQYIAKVTKVGMCLISVKVKGKEVSRHEFRAKRVPDPRISLNGKLFGGQVQPGTLNTMTGIVPLLMDFDFEMRYSVTGFTLNVNHGGKLYTLSNNGPLITADMKALISKTQKGDVVIFDEVRVVGADNQPRLLGSISFVIL